MLSNILTRTEADALRREGKIKGYAKGHVVWLRKGLRASEDRPKLKKGEPVLVIGGLYSDTLSVRIGNHVYCLNKSFFNTRGAIPVAFNFF